MPDQPIKLPTSAPKSPLQEGIIFALKKFLEHSRVILAEQDILNKQLDTVSTAIKKKRVRQFIDTLSI